MGGYMSNVSHETNKQVSMRAFHLSEEEYESIDDKFLLYVCAENKIYDDYHGKINRDLIVKYGIIDMLKEPTIDKEKITFTWRSILHEYFTINDDLF